MARSNVHRLKVVPQVVFPRTQVPRGLHRDSGQVGRVTSLHEMQECERFAQAMAVGRESRLWRDESVSI